MTPCIYAGCVRPARVWPDGLRACGHHRELCNQGPAGLETIAVEQEPVTREMVGMPEPYYDRGGIAIYHGDCRDLLPRLEPGSVDLVLTDPPCGAPSALRSRSGTAR